MSTANTTAAEPQLAYTPGSLLNAVGNSLVSPLFNKTFAAKGVYRAGKGVNYNGSYYDVLKDEFTDNNMVLVVPERLRSQLRDGQLIEVSVYLSKRFQAGSGRIDLLLTLGELLAKKEKVVDEQATKALDLLQKKANAGYKDADAFIRKRLFEQKPIAVTIIVGQGAIIDQDIKHQLREAVLAYEFRYVRANLSQVPEITQALFSNQETDILVIARGGGENMNVFDNPAIGEAALQLRCIFITALGHTSDEPLLQKIADKFFITPTALGGYFHELYNKTLDDLNHSKTKLIADLSKQIELSYQHKVQDLENRLAEITRSDLATRERLAETIRLDLVTRERSDQRVRELSERLIKTKAVLVGAVVVVVSIVLYFIFRRI
ncbi:MAG TPA: exodeoxyribonuclease VII large subunit [Puia sp.]|nr:exodeoxyribonuclease VII large subunit [Puia sp.]